MNETTQQEKTTQLNSRNEQLNSAAGTKQLNSPVGTKQLTSEMPSATYNRLHRLQPPETAYNRLQPPAPPLQQNRLFLPTNVALFSYTRAFGDGRRNFEPWLSDVDNT
ncbi:hypothetical protein TNCV_3702561 [Trichonephila clavipes]|nr:hypothetical protein TNCV_3702561 [Trichonephila clavipes]